MATLESDSKEVKKQTKQTTTKVQEQGGEEDKDKNEEDDSWMKPDMDYYGPIPAGTTKEQESAKQSKHEWLLCLADSVPITHFSHFQHSERRNSLTLYVIRQSIKNFPYH